MHRERCLCSSIPKLNFRSRLSLVIHAKELKRTTNTGLLAAKALGNSVVIVRGATKEAVDLSSLLDPSYQTVLFYPSEDAVDLTELVRETERPINLIVPDGNWRQASKVHYRHRELSHLPRVMIKTSSRETQHLRAESNDHGMATLLAIAQAMGIIEGPGAEIPLTQLYRLKLARTLSGRGQTPSA